MNRAIKMRAWDTTTNKWLEGLTLTLHCSGNLINVPDNVILTWWTGLKDCNGRDIYEGDILGVPGEPRTFFRVVWDDANGAWARQDSWGSHAPLSEDPIGTRDIVLGNIYENPELMKVKHDG